MKICKTCGSEFEESKHRKVFCSVVCKQECFKEFSFKKGHGKGELGYQWKGDDATYFSKHTWVAKQKGKASMCEHCHESGKKYQWSNIDHKYSRKLEDYVSLCISCHLKYDRAVGNRVMEKGYDVDMIKELVSRGYSYRKVAREMKIGSHATVTRLLRNNY